MNHTTQTGNEPTRSNFIRDIVDEDLATGRHKRVVTRFPPEPNGYLHIGHAKSICLNFGIARDYAMRGVPSCCHLRFDDTNPTREDVEYVEAIKRDIQWLGFDWGDKLFFASDYFERMYEIALFLIRQDQAYVDSSTLEEIRQQRGTLTEPGQPNRFRQRCVDENLDLFARMRKGEFPDGTHVLRAKIDLAAKNMLMRDPVLYRIRHAHHHRTGNAWCIYPMYDYAHPLSDAFEHITHSICTLEFENNREFYDWLIGQAQPLLQAVPHQYEFARLSLACTMMSKRNLLKLVEEKVVSGWDDPRMPTIAGLRRRGYTPEAIRDFADMIGVAKANSQVDFEKLEYCIRNDLNHRAPRRMCVLEPLLVVLSNYPQGQTEEVIAQDFPAEVNRPGSRSLRFSRTLWIDRQDFAEVPQKGFHRLSPGQEVRLLYAYVIRCDEVVKDATGQVIELRCSFDPESRSGETSRRVKGNIHWVEAASALPCEVRLYDRLFVSEQPGDTHDFHEDLNPESLKVHQTAFVEPTVAADPPGFRYQFARQGYFSRDPVEVGALVFNRIVGLRDSWAKQNQPEMENKPVDAQTAQDSEIQTVEADKCRPQKKTRAQFRAAAREKDPRLAACYARYLGDWGLGEEEADVLSGETAIADFFEAACATYPKPQSLAKWMMGEVLRAAKDRPLGEWSLRPEQLAQVAQRVDAGDISVGAGKTLLADLLQSGGDVNALVEKLGLRKLSDEAALLAVLDKILAEQAENVARYKAGKKTLLGFFVGQVLKATSGAADPALLRTLVLQRLGE